nr:phosphoenolpyruvate carboxykinase (ATP) [Saprospiraceae bacterium]
MNETGIKNPKATIKDHGFDEVKIAHWNLTPEELVEATIKRDMGVLSDSGAICISTGKFTGRSPGDRFIVEDDVTRDTVDWNKINMPFKAEKFDGLRRKIIDYLGDKEVYVRDAYACSDSNYRLNLRLITEFPWSNQFGHNMFLRPQKKDLQNFEPEWLVICAPGFEAVPDVDGTKNPNFAIINFTEKTIIVGGTAYTGEIKKGIFSVLNYVLPFNKNVLSMHCSANLGKKGDTAVFFGLSGTGKTTLSADPNRQLIGDDEHGWSEHGIFNFEGGCYAKCINLSADSEPEIHSAIKHRAILENIVFYEGSRRPNYDDDSITQNTRVSYPIYHIENAVGGSKGGHPKNIFFLTCDAFGVLPPISKLTPGQAMYHFISGYTAKVAGTEEGIVEPQVAFSACFGAPFLPLHPTKYAEMLGERMQKHEVKIWLVNTGWSGGPYGTGSRIKLTYTRAMINAAIDGRLNGANFTEHEIFGLAMPNSCPSVPSEILHPENTWSDRANYDEKANKLARFFVDNFAKFADEASDEIRAAAPRVR